MMSLFFFKKNKNIKEHIFFFENFITNLISKKTKENIKQLVKKKRNHKTSSKKRTKAWFFIHGKLSGI